MYQFFHLVIIKSAKDTFLRKNRIFFENYIMMDYETH